MGWNREQIELAFIREFAHGANSYLASMIGSVARVERIRELIFVNERETEMLAGGELSYADAFKLWSGQVLERRTKPRDPVDDEFDIDETIQALWEHDA